MWPASLSELVALWSFSPDKRINKMQLKLKKFGVTDSMGGHLSYKWSRRIVAHTASSSGITFRQ